MNKFLLLFLILFTFNSVFSQTAYNFTGNGNWTVASNWENSIIPPAILPAGSIINIQVATGDSCVLNTAQTISPGASLFIVSGANFIISGNLENNAVIDSLTVTIGTQVWMKQNLTVSKYRNGDPVPQVTDPNEWSTLTTGAWSWYKNDSAKYAATYGKLYNWYAVNDSRGLAPAGWHIPTSSEWAILSNFLGGDALAGAAMKATSAQWGPPNTGATNASGFTGLPGGYHDYTGYFYSLGDAGYWWSATSTGIYAAYRYLYFANTTLYNLTGGKENGISVRCVKD